MDGIQALGELGLSVDELLAAGREDAFDEDDPEPHLIQQDGPTKGRNGVEGLRRMSTGHPLGLDWLDWLTFAAAAAGALLAGYLKDGLENDTSDRRIYVYGTPSAEQVEAHLAYQRALVPPDFDSGDDDQSEDEAGPDAVVVKVEATLSEDEGIEPDGESGAEAETQSTAPTRPARMPSPPLSLAALKAEVAAEEKEDECGEAGGARTLPFGRRMAHLPAFPTTTTTAAAGPAGLPHLSASFPRSGTPLLGAVPHGPRTLSRAGTPALGSGLPGRASVEPPAVGGAADDGQPSFLRPIPFARLSLASEGGSGSGASAEAGASIPLGPDGQTAHSAPTMAHSATLPALISAYSALNRAIIAEPNSALAGGQPPAGGKNAKRLRAAYHLSFQSAPPEAYSPSPSLFASLAVPSARTTAVVPQIPPLLSGVVLPAEVARVRSRAVVAGLPTTALAPSGAHRHPNMLANVLHYIAPPALLLRTSRMAEPGPLVEKAKELYYGPVYDGKGVIVTTTGGGIIRHRLPPAKPVGGTHPKGPKGKGKSKGHKKKGGRDSDDEFEALLLDGPPPDDDDGLLVVSSGVGGLGSDAGVEWEEEEEELVVEVKEVDVELRATVGPSGLLWLYQPAVN
jgi:hypothetical protein